jgi:hypothetical protein
MKFILEEEQLVIELEGVEKFFGLKNRLNIPEEKITGLEWHSEMTYDERIWRVAGTGIPGVLYAGHFRGHGDWYYLYLHQPHGISWVDGAIIAQNTLVITTIDFPYRQILVTCLPEIGEQLVRWWRGI